MKKREAGKKIKYTDEPIDLEIIPDFLPPPEKLAMKDETVKVTIALSKDSVEFFKREAKRHHGSYQAMIRKAIDLYAAHYQKA